MLLKYVLKVTSFKKSIILLSTRTNFYLYSKQNFNPKYNDNDKDKNINNQQIKNQNIALLSNSLGKIRSSNLPIQEEILKQQNLTEKNDKEIQIQKSPKNSLDNIKNNIAYCHALPEVMGEKELRDYFDPKGNQIIRINLIKNKLGLRTNKAFIEFVDEKACVKACNQYGENFIQTQDITQRIVMKPFQLKTKNRRIPYDLTQNFVYIGNLDYDCSSEDLYSFLIDFGDIEFLDMPLQQLDQNKNKGFASVRFTSKKIYEKLKLFLEENKFRDRNIRVQSQQFEFLTQQKRYKKKSDMVAEKCEEPFLGTMIEENQKFYEDILKSQPLELEETDKQQK